MLLKIGKSTVIMTVAMAKIIPTNKPYVMSSKTTARHEITQIN